MNRYGKRCVLYPRVSTEMQVDGYSLEGQKNMLTRFADREEMIVVDTYEDAGKSGKSIEGRPAFQKMLRDIEDGLDIDYILVYKLSRFGRNAADILNSLELVQSYGVNLICIEEGIDSSQTSGKLLISVLSAVAEIERENIIEQTMNGRREKARQGGWNGGFAPYGYTLEDNKLMIEETEAVAIRKIFELYTSSEIGLGGIANQLNLQGIRKIPRQNGTLEDWTGHFIKLILDNPVYCGKIAYGRRTKEKVKGTKNDYQMKRNDDYILTEGQHKGIVSEEVWEKAHAKRLRTGVKQPSKIGRDRVHLLSGLLKCPVCGSPMYTNKHAWTNKDGTYKEIYYYVCSRNRMVRGKHCEYKAMLKKTDIEPMVIEAIREIVRNEEYAQAIKKRIGVQIDTKAVDKELEGYQAKLKEVDLNKTRLEREIDSLPADAKYRERKLHDMTLRLDSLYDVIVELEEKIEDARLRRDAIKQQAITLENIYKIMVNFDCVYNIINDEEKRNVVTALIKEIEIYRNDESEYPLKRIGLNFPVFKDGGEVTELLWDKGNTVDSHNVADSKTYTVASDIVYNESNKRGSDAVAATNEFDFAEGEITYLSRADGFANYAEATAAPATYEMTDEQKAAFDNAHTYTEAGYQNDDDANAADITTGAKNGLKLVDLRGVDYNDAKWDQLLDQMTIDEMQQTIGFGGYQTAAVSSIEKVRTNDCDGPASINNNFTGVGSVGFPAATLIGMTWDKELAYAFGDSIGEMANEMDTSGWYGPAMNIHRTAFAGRNFEYYSEDGVLSGRMASNAILGAQEHGVYAYMKHFALNDQEGNRTSMAATWSNEQAIREIYLKPFEISVKDADCHAVMSSFNYIGTRWAGGCKELLKNVLRGEWGFVGFVETDYFGVYGYMTADQGVRNGSDLMLCTTGNDFNTVTVLTNSSKQALREASKNILYTVVNSRAYAAENLNPGMAKWEIIMIGADVLVALLIVALEIKTFKSYKKRKEEEEENA